MRMKLHFKGLQFSFGELCFEARRLQHFFLVLPVVVERKDDRQNYPIDDDPEDLSVDEEEKMNCFRDERRGCAV